MGNRTPTRHFSPASSRGEIPQQGLWDAHVLAFRHQTPGQGACAGHPEGSLCLGPGFRREGLEAEIVAFPRGEPGGGEASVAVTGYRLIANAGADGHQEVPHYHPYSGRPADGADGFLLPR